MNSAENQVAAQWNVGDVILDLYEVKEIHEGGGMGVVYRVHHRGWNIDLAVKSPRPEFFQTERQKENFIRECETWINLGLHPHIASCYYIRSLGNIPRIFAEYVEGGTLREWIDSRNLYEGGPHEALERILDIAIQMAWALHFGHEQGLIHQDVKPANVLMTADGTAKVTDFGLAKARAASAETVWTDADRSILVSSGGMTPAYCSPEQANRQALTRRSDIWSWGVSVLEMFVGGVCWQSGAAAGAVLEQLNEVQFEGLDLPDMPDQFRNLLNHCFEFDPEARPKSFSEIVERLLTTYRAQVNDDYARLEPSLTKLRADGLNNRAVSLFDLGRERAALAALDEALTIDPNHIEAIYNRGLLRWRKAEITDQVLLAELKGASAATEQPWRAKLALGLVHLERGDNESARQELEIAAKDNHNAPEVAIALQRATNAKHSRRCIQTFEEHTSLFSCFVVSPSRRWGLSAGWDNSIRFWELETGRCIRTLEGHTGKVEFIAISPDGDWALSASEYSNTLYLWELSSGRNVRKLKLQSESDYFLCATFTPDGRMALSGGCDLLLWDLETGKCVKKFEVFHVTECIAISPDGRRALTGHFVGNEVHLWDLASIRWWDFRKTRPTRTLKGHESSVSSIAISPDGRWVLSSSLDNTLRLWEAESGKCVRIFRAPEEMTGAVAVAISQDGRWCWSNGGKLRVWELETGRCVRTFERAGELITTAVSRDCAWTLSWNFDDSLSNYAFQLWELRASCNASPFMVCIPHATHAQINEADKFNACMEKATQAIKRQEWEEAARAIRDARNCNGFAYTRESLDAWAAVGRHGTKKTLSRGWCVRTFDGHADKIYSVAISQDGKTGLSGSYDETVRLWELQTGRCLQTCRGHRGCVHCVAISPDGLWGLSGSLDYTLRLWELESGRCARTFEGHTSWVSRVTISADGRWILSASDDKTVRLWELGTGRCVKVLTGYEDVALSPCGRWALSTKGDIALEFWELATGRCLRTLFGRTPVAIAPDGRRILSGLGDNKMFEVRELASGQAARTFEGHEFSISRVTISSDSRWAVSGSHDDTLRLWDMASGKCLWTLEGHTSSVISVAISRDGRWCLSGSFDRTVRLWELDWEYAFPKTADLDEGVKPYLEIFLILRCPIGDDGITRVGKPRWIERDFHLLLAELQDRGYGWLHPAGVRRELERLTAEWQNPPPVLLDM